MSKTREKQKDASRKLARQFKRQQLPDGDLWRSNVPDYQLRSKRA